MEKKKLDYADLVHKKDSIARSARIWSIVKAICEACNEERITYDDFVEICEIIISYSQYVAEVLQQEQRMDYKREHSIPLNNELDPHVLEDESLTIDLDNGDGEWFIIPDLN